MTRIFSFIPPDNKLHWMMRHHSNIQMCFIFRTSQIIYTVSFFIFISVSKQQHNCVVAEENNLICTLCFPAEYEPLLDRTVNVSMQTCVSAEENHTTSAVR